MTVVEGEAGSAPAAVQAVASEVVGYWANSGKVLEVHSCWKAPEAGLPQRTTWKFLASAETARLRLRRVALGGASMASELFVAKHTKETAHSSRTKEFFQLEANKVLRVSPIQRGSSGNCLEIEKPAVHLAVSDVCHIPAQGPVRWLHVISFLCA